MSCAGPDDIGEQVSLAEASTALAKLPGYEEFVKLYYPQLKNYARSIMGENYADDLAQETMIIVARRWDYIHFPGRYAFRVMGRLCGQLIARLTRESNYLARHTLDEMRELGMEVIAEEWSRRKVDDLIAEQEFLREIFGLLTLQQARCLFAKYILDYNSKEIGLLLGIKPSTVRVHLVNAHKRIAVSLGVFRE
jgi:RNA polymerase sigma factor (sigma-70 family)